MVKARYILIVSLILLLAGIYIVGRSASTAGQLGGQILAADAAGQPVTTAEQQLSHYVHAHMGASITVFLNSSYSRAVQAAVADQGSSGQVYQAAQAACVSHTTAVVQAQCVQNYLSSHASSAPAPAPSVDRQAYTLSYTSPKWTPDVAGLILAASLLGLVAGLGWWLRGRF